RPGGACRAPTWCTSPRSRKRRLASRATTYTSPADLPSSGGRAQITGEKHKYERQTGEEESAEEPAYLGACLALRNRTSGEYQYGIGQEEQADDQVVCRRPGRARHHGRPRFDQCLQHGAWPGPIEK